jgi:hypothetical protein
MRIATIGVIAFAGLLAGCSRSSASGGAHGDHARFSGVGVYDAGRMWQHMAAQDPKDPALARLADDEHIIAVVDGRTGEVRQCGDHSGYCVTMNPWAGPVPQGLPVRLLKHAADFEAGPVDAERKPLPAASGK